MFKTIKAELKKMVSKPGIYILVVLLAIILVLGVFTYDPTEKHDNKLEIASETFLETYNKYVETSGFKETIDNNITLKINRINSYHVGDKTQKENINNLLEAFKLSYNDYKESSLVSNLSYSESCKNNLKDKLNILNNTISSGISSAKNNIYLIISNKQNYKSYQSAYEEIASALGSNSLVGEICNEIKLYEDKFYNAINNLIYPTLTDNFINNYTKNEEGCSYYIIKNRLQEIDNQIKTLKLEIDLDGNKNTEIKYINDLVALIENYVNCGNTYTELIDLELLSNAFSITTPSEQMNLLYLSEKSEYNTNSLLIRQKYLFENNKKNQDFAHPLTIGVASNENTNAFDYTYYVLRLFSFIIIVFAIMSISNAISGEIKEGTMRYLAIRPITRTRLLFGKMLSVIIMSFILICFSTIIGLCVGGSFYGFSSANILTIFNSSSAIILSPVAMLLFFILSFMLELTVYVAIAMMFACLLKSDLLTVTLMLVLYLINTLLPGFAGGVNSWLAFYPFSHINLYALFGSSLYADANNTLANLFGSHVYAGTNLILTIIVIVITSLLFSLIANFAFKKKEL